MTTLAQLVNNTASDVRVIVDLYDALTATHYYYSASAYRYQSGFTEPRLLGISPATYSISYDGMQIPSVSITLDNTDNSIASLGIGTKDGWEVSIIVDQADPSLDDERSARFKISKPAMARNNTIEIVAEAYGYSQLGKITLPQITSDDVTSLSSTLPNIINVVGRYVPAYLGAHIESGGAVEAWNMGLSKHLVACTPSTDTNANMDGTYTYFVYNSDDVLLGSGKTTLTSVNLSRPGESPATWKLWYLQTNSDTSGDYNVRLNITPPADNGRTRADGGTGNAWTPPIYLDRILDYWADTLDTKSNIADSTNLLSAHDDCEDSGIETRLAITEPITTVDLINSLFANSGCYLSFRYDGKLIAGCMRESNKSDVRNAYSSNDSLIDWKHFISMSRDDKFIVNEMYVKNNNGETVTITDQDSIDISWLQSDAFSGPASNSSMYEAAWRRMQEKRNCINVATITGTTTIRSYNIDPLDKIILTENWSGYSDQPMVVTEITYNYMDLTADIVLQTLDGWTNTNGYILIDESTLARTSPATGYKNLHNINNAYALTTSDYSAPGVTSINVDTVVKLEGRSSIRVVFPASTSLTWCWTDINPGPGSNGKTYTGYFWLKGLAGGEKISYYIYDRTNTTATTFTPATLTTSWQKFSVSITVSGGDSSDLELTFKPQTGSEPAMTIYADAWNLYTATSTNLEIALFSGSTDAILHGYYTSDNITVGDIIEFRTASNSFSAVVNSGPAIGSGDFYHITLSETADADELISSSDFSVYKSYDNATASEQADGGWLADDNGQLGAANDDGFHLLF